MHFLVQLDCVWIENEQGMFFTAPMQLNPTTNTPIMDPFSGSVSLQIVLKKKKKGELMVNLLDNFDEKVNRGGGL